LLGEGRGAFAPAPSSPITVVVRPHVHGVAAADFNGDGFLDLVIAFFVFAIARIAAGRSRFLTGT
jgi:hypothetical protein